MPHFISLSGLFPMPQVLPGRFDCRVAALLPLQQPQSPADIGHRAPPVPLQAPPRQRQPGALIGQSFGTPTHLSSPIFIAVVVELFCFFAQQQLGWPRYCAFVMRAKARCLPHSNPSDRWKTQMFRRVQLGKFMHALKNSPAVPWARHPGASVGSSAGRPRRLSHRCVGHAPGGTPVLLTLFLLR